MKIIAFQVQDLTVARYFAAFLVDMMHFHVPKTERLSELLAHYAEIINWIDGPEIMISTDFTDLDSIFQINEILSPQYFICSIEQRERMSLSFPGLKYIADQPLDHDEDDEFVILDFERDHEFASHISIPKIYKIRQQNTLQDLQPQNIFGIGLEAGVEETTGIKDFAEVDEILEWIEEYR